MSGGERPKGFVPGRFPIDAYGNGGFRFADMSHKGSILALPSGIYAWSPVSIAELTPQSFDLIRREADAIDTLLIGTGADPAFLDDAIVWRLREGRMAVDAMTTGSAARTYNIMLGENRRVAAALIAVA
jgi:uncharacterized protein